MLLFQNMKELLILPMKQQPFVFILLQVNSLIIDNFSLKNFTTTATISKEDLQKHLI